MGKSANTAKPSKPLASMAGAIRRGSALAKGATKTPELPDDVRGRIATALVAVDHKQEAVKAAELAVVEASPLLAFFRDDFDVDDEESLRLANEQVVELRTKKKALEARRKTFTDPLTRAIKENRAAIDEAKSWFAPGETLLTQCEDVLKLKMSVFVRELEEANREKLQLVAAASKKSDHVAVTTALAAVQTVEKLKGVSFGEVWDFKPTNLHMVPAEFLLLNAVAVREWMNAVVKKGEDPIIPGVLFFKKPTTSVHVPK